MTVPISTNLAKARKIPVVQARAEVYGYEKTHRENVAAATQQTVDAAQTATAAVSAGAVLGFIALVLGAIASWFGGVSGTQHSGVIVADTATCRTV